MGRIKIIHISDILVGSLELDINSRVRQIQQAAISYDLDRKIDYIVISGNITRDGSTQDFTKAQDFIRAIASILLTRDGREIRLNRVTIVPGKNDIVEPGIFEGHYANFKTFHDHLFEREISDGRVEKFSHERALIRELKDITIIGLCCWRTNSDNEIDGVAERRINSIYEAASHLPSLRYTKSTQTILVTAEIPLSAWSLTRLYDQRLRELLINHLKITLNLFGSGDASCINPEPFSFKHISIGTGPRLQEGAWPLRINLIETDKFNLTSQYIKIIRFQRYENITPWEKEDFNIFFKNNQNLEVNIEPRNWNKDYLCIEFLKKIEAKNPNFRPGIVLVKAFPGSGKETLFQDYKKNISIGNQEVFVIVGQLHSYADMDNEVKDEINNNGQLSYRQELRRILSLVENFNNNQHNLINKIIVLYDFIFAKTPNSEKTQALFKVRNDLSIFRDSTIIYITEPLDITTGFENYCISILELSAFPESVDKLVEEYCYYLPVISEHIKYLTGGYFEFSNLLLQESQKRFELWSGSEPINRKSSGKLIREAIQNSRSIKEKSHLFRAAIETFNGGTEVFRYIQSIVRRTIPDLNVLFQEQLNPIYIKTTEIIENLSYHIRNAALQVIKMLTEYGILENPFHDDEYILKLVIPFLVSMDTYSVFISFPAKYQTQAEQLSTLLINIAKTEGKSMNSWVFTQRTGENNSITQRINKALKKSKNLIILFEGENFTSPYTEGEYSKWERIWRDRWRVSDAKCIPVSLNSFSAEFPYAFGTYDIIDASNGLSTKAVEIFRLLIPDDNSIDQNYLEIGNLFDED